ncbi:MAG: hypothetical protein ABS15_04440 [SAR86 cluster bacterium BACL1 MAG-120823-bin87]|nr:MAG: hypothetical protein ABS15_04440 [SAR86 cluster bacterium BACL1 MAG-120823-bin87]
MLLLQNFKLFLKRLYWRGCLETNLLVIRKKQEDGFKVDEKYIKFYKTFHKGFKNNKKSNSLFKTNQSRWNKKIFLVGQKNNILL